MKLTYGEAFKILINFLPKIRFTKISCMCRPIVMVQANSSLKYS